MSSNTSVNISNQIKSNYVNDLKGKFDSMCILCPSKGLISKSGLNEAWKCNGCGNLAHKSCGLKLRIVDGKFLKCCGDRTSSDSLNFSVDTLLKDGVNESINDNGFSISNVVEHPSKPTNENKFDALFERMFTKLSTDINKNFEVNSKKIEADISKIKESLLLVLSSNNEIMNNNIAKISSSLEKCEATFLDLSARVESVESKVSSLRNEYDNRKGIIDNKLKELENTKIDISSSLDKKLANVEKRLNGLINSNYVANDKADSDNVKEDINVIVSELKERELKKNNIIFFNLVESTEKNVKQADRDCIVEILKLFPTIDSSNIIVRRIGKIEVGKTRPIVVTLKSFRDVYFILKNRKLLPSKINVSSDKTKLQRNMYDELKRRMFEHNEKFPQDKVTIKHFNDIPKLIKISEISNIKNITHQSRQSNELLNGISLIDNVINMSNGSKNLDPPGKGLTT